MVKLVPYPPYGDDITGLGGILLYFFTKSVHVNHYCSVVSVVFKLPYQFKQLVIRNTRWGFASGGEAQTLLVKATGVPSTKTVRLEVYFRPG